MSRSSPIRRPANRRPSRRRESRAAVVAGRARGTWRRGRRNRALRTRALAGVDAVASLPCRSAARGPHDRATERLTSANLRRADRPFLFAARPCFAAGLCELGGPAGAGFGGALSRRLSDVVARKTLRACNTYAVASVARV